MHVMMQPCENGGYHSLMLADTRRDTDAIRCRWVPCYVQLAAEEKPALVTALRVGRASSAATREEIKQTQALLPPSGGYYGARTRIYTNDGPDDASDLD